ncbi:imm11 family protein [Litchfieldia salsa]|uniref:Immunity MXAN-0049 protein domain-containing protein n=1 Tax=Litchfieldia salsa TaxID=930152 RepID=A0A1H0PW56_9BACI|nr:DUF1629 domain-containing protein [Litchfieldia salsa]SDP09333.1 hypothetical protein SAMN05216565_101493 [Litchfieldia salsa]
MKVWLLKRAYANFEVFRFSDQSTGKLFRKNFRGVPMSENWETLQIETFKKGQKSDFPSGLLSPPSFSEKAVQVLGDLLKGEVELLPMITENDDKYYVGNVTNILDCIDKDNSEVEVGEGGLVDDYLKYAFIEDVIKDCHIFRIVTHDTYRLLKTQVFVSDLFREKVLEARLSGFEFIEVWDSTKRMISSTKNKISSFHRNSEKFYTFEEASMLVRNHNKIVLSDEWAIRLGEDKKVQIGHLQEDGTFRWLNPIYYPPMFIEMKWRILE